MAKKIINGFEIITNVDLSVGAPSDGGGDVGPYFQDFESGTQFPEYQPNENPWFVTTARSYSGTQSFRSGNITHGQTSSISLTIPDSGTFSFRYFQSSESNYDYMYFYLNGVQLLYDSGQSSDWVLWSREVSAGDVATWEYVKDGSVSSGDDCVYIDDVGFSDIVEETPTMCMPYRDLTLQDRFYEILNSDYMTVETEQRLQDLWEPYDIGFSLDTDGWNVYGYTRPRTFSSAQSGIKIIEPRSITGEVDPHVLSQFFRPDSMCVYVKFHDVPTGLDPSVTVELLDGNADLVLASGTINKTYEEYSSGEEYYSVNLDTSGLRDMDYYSYPLPDTQVHYWGTPRPTHLRFSTGDHGILVRVVRPLDGDGNKEHYVFANTEFMDTPS